jgi:uncharacterized protein YejL (UPF0352 family)
MSAYSIVINEKGDTFVTEQGCIDYLNLDPIFVTNKVKQGLQNGTIKKGGTRTAIRQTISRDGILGISEIKGEENIPLIPESVVADWLIEFHQINLILLKAYLVDGIKLNQQVLCGYALRSPQKFEVTGDIGMNPSMYSPINETTQYQRERILGERLKALEEHNKKLDMSVSALTDLCGKLIQTKVETEIEIRDAKLVYLVGNKEGKILKIGITNNLKQRLANLQNSSPYELHVIKTKPGNINTETELLERFKTFVLRGEWLIWDDSIIENF